MAEQTNHTPTPWELSGLGYRVLKGAEVVAMCDTNTCSADEARANARLIVRAVNAHAGLVAALERKLELERDHRRFDLAYEKRESHRAWLEECRQANIVAQAALDKAKQ